MSSAKGLEREREVGSRVRTVMIYMRRGPRAVVVEGGGFLEDCRFSALWSPLISGLYTGGGNREQQRTSGKSSDIGRDRDKKGMVQVKAKAAYNRPSLVPLWLRRTDSEYGKRAVQGKKGRKAG